MGLSAAAELLLPLRMANRAPATACGLSRPVTLVPFAVVAVVRGWGSMLVRLEAASELAGLRGVVSSTGLGGWSDARRLLKLLLYARGGAEACAARRGLVTERCAGGGPGEASRSRKERRDPFLDGVSSGIGDADAARERGLRSVGSLEADEGVKPGPERTGVGLLLA